MCVVIRTRKGRESSPKKSSYSGLVHDVEIGWKDAGRGLTGTRYRAIQLVKNARVCILYHKTRRD